MTKELSKVELTFGKHKGEKLGDVPASYLLYLVEQDWFQNYIDVAKYVMANRVNLEAEKKNERYESN